MKKNILLLGSILAISTPAFSSSSEMLREEFRNSIKENPRFVAYIRDVVNIPDKDKVMDEIVFPNKAHHGLNFKEVTEQIFDNKYWVPESTVFDNAEIEGLLSGYKPQVKDIDDYNIFIANLLYKAGSQYYNQAKTSKFLEYAASIGHPAAQNKMFRIKVRSQRFHEAKNYLLSASAQKDPEALFSLSKAYLGLWKIDLPKDVEMSKALCQEAANLGHEEARFRVEVASLTEGFFGSQINYQEGIRKAKMLADQGNKCAIDFINSLMESSGDALMEGNEEITYEDLDFLRSYLGWKDENEE